MSNSDKNRVIIAEVIAKAWQDPEFRHALINNTRETLDEAGMEFGSGEINVVCNDATTTYVVLPPGDNLGGFGDDAMKLLNEAMPLGVHEIRLVQNSDERSYIVLPQAPADFEEGELSDEALDTVAGGSGYHDVAVNVEAAANAVAAANAAAYQNAAAATEAAAAAVAVAVAAVVFT